MPVLVSVHAEDTRSSYSNSSSSNNISAAIAAAQLISEADLETESVAAAAAGERKDIP